MKILVLLLILVVILSAQLAMQKPPAKRISAEEAHKMMLELKDKDYILLDVRTEKEFKEKRISNAILIPDYEIKQRAKAELTDKNKVILVYCRSGRRSANAAAELLSLGYTKVYDFGGILDWNYETYP